MLPKVLWIGIDGCQLEALLTSAPFVTNHILPNSYYSFDSHCPISISGPSWKSYLTGVHPRKHGILNNKFKKGDISVKRSRHSSSREIPDIFQLVGKEHCHVINSRWNQFDQIMSMSSQQTNRPLTCCRQILSPAVAQGETPSLLFYYDSRIDDEGHRSGFSMFNAKYRNKIREMDQIINQLVTLLRNRSGEHWLLVLLTDHGGSRIKDITSPIEDILQLPEYPPTSVNLKKCRKKKSLFRQQFRTAKNSLKFSKSEQGFHGMPIPSHTRTFQIYYPVPPSGNYRGSLHSTNTKSREILPEPNYQFPIRMTLNHLTPMLSGW